MQSCRPSIRSVCRRGTSLRGSSPCENELRPINDLSLARCYCFGRKAATGFVSFGREAHTGPRTQDAGTTYRTRTAHDADACAWSSVSSATRHGGRGRSHVLMVSAAAPRPTRLLGREHVLLLLASARAGVAGHRGAGHGGRRQTVGRFSAPRLAVRPIGRPRWHSARALD